MEPTTQTMPESPIDLENLLTVIDVNELRSIILMIREIKKMRGELEEVIEVLKVGKSICEKIACEKGCLFC